MTKYESNRVPILQPGTLLGGYRIDEVIGHGGMGVVYEATQLSLKRTIAVKLLASHLSEDPRFRERFRREGELQARLDHPHIVTVHEAGESEHGLFLAMRLVRGPRLKDLILARELNAERTVRILAPIADALDAAHEEGLIHRDVKPQNILVAARDHAFLADFGLTKLPGEKSLTDTGQFMGTLDYVAPEQIVGEPPTARTDVYAFAAVLCECLTGTVPYPRENEAAVLYAHLSDQPPRLSEREPRLPADVDEVVTRGLAKEAGDRYATAGELMDDVAHALGGVHLRAIPQPKPVITPPQRAVLARESKPTDEIADQGPPRGPDLPTSKLSEPDESDRRGARRYLPYAAVALVMAAAGAAVGALTSESEPSARTQQSRALGVTLPAGWKERPEPIDGLELSNSVGAADGDRGIFAGLAQDPGVSLLPQKLEELTGGRARSGGEPIKVGELDARRFNTLPLRGTDAELTVYAVPTSAGVATVACYAPPEDAIADECGATATTLQVRRGRPFSLTPDPDYGAAVNRVIRDLQKTRRLLRQRLGKATTRYQQHTAAGQLRTAFTRAADRVERVRPRAAEADAHARIIRALRNGATVYRRLQRAAQAGDAAAYEQARQQIGPREGDFQGALDALKPLGYTIQ